MASLKMSMQNIDHHSSSIVFYFAPRAVLGRFLGREEVHVLTSRFLVVS